MTPPNTAVSKIKQKQIKINTTPSQTQISQQSNRIQSASSDDFDLSVEMTTLNSKFQKQILNVISPRPNLTLKILLTKSRSL